MKKIPKEYLDMFVDTFREDFNRLSQDYIQKYGGEECCISASRLYGMMEYIHDNIRRINQDHSLNYRLPELPKR